jgi:hypothetical protein
MKSLRPAPVRKFRNMSTGQKVGTVIFRVIVGIVGLIILIVGIKYRLYAQDLRTFAALGAFCGMTLGYAIAGDKLAARLVHLFWGRSVHVEEEPNTTTSQHSDASVSPSERRNV